MSAFARFSEAASVRCGAILSRSANVRFVFYTGAKFDLPAMIAEQPTSTMSAIWT